jgi:hypothetical protein
MAKYEINHACGHTSTKQLFGKNSERTRRIEWLETQDCPDCWAAKQREIESAQPITATIGMSNYRDNSGKPLVQIALTGGTVNHKDNIKALGYHWEDNYSGIMSMISTKAPGKAWCKQVDIDDLKREIVALKDIAERVENGISALDLEMMRRWQQEATANAEKKAAQEQAAAAIEKPVSPECYPSRRGRWNGKVYGNAKYGYRVYVDGCEERITTDEVEKIKTHQAAMEKYRIAVDAAKQEVAA